MNYGIISRLDDDTTTAVFKGKRIPAENIVANNQVDRLAQVLKAEDVVYVISVNRFYNLGQFLSFAQVCQTRGVTVHLVAQPYLDFGNGKYWKTSIRNLLVMMQKIEYSVKTQMTQQMNLTRAQWECIYRGLEIMSLEILARIFSADGILRRGN